MILPKSLKYLDIGGKFMSPLTEYVLHQSLTELHIRYFSIIKKINFGIDRFKVQFIQNK